jgi:hypothetical protein
MGIRVGEWGMFPCMDVRAIARLRDAGYTCGVKREGKLEDCICSAS